MKLKQMRAKARLLNDLAEKLPLEERKFLEKRNRMDWTWSLIQGAIYSFVLTAAGAVVTASNAGRDVSEVGGSLALMGAVWFILMGMLPWLAMGVERRRLVRTLKAHGLVPADLDVNAKNLAVPNSGAILDAVQAKDGTGATVEVVLLEGKKRRSRA